MDNTLGIIDNSSHKTNPKPTDFDKFVPWACKEFSVVVDVIVVRAVQKSYEAVVPPKKKTKNKVKKQPSTMSPVTVSEASLIVEKAVLSDENKIMIESFYNSNGNLVQLKLLKNKVIPRKVMQTIALTLPYQPHLTSITINGGLRMDTLYEISKFLPNSYITELCLDSTFLSQANYHILLTKNYLKHLSLSKCMINDAVIKTIADQLKEPCPASQILSALNLSNNRITDVGAKYLADMLRTNRQLSYLNLAGNMITDEGGMSILDTLHEFPLHAQELFESRTRYVAYLKQKNDLINTYIKDHQTISLNKNLIKKKSPKKGKLSQPLQYTYTTAYAPSQKHRMDSVTEVQFIQEKAQYLAERTMGSFNEPFSPSNTKTLDGVVHCFGNNTLCHLNIAYNNLTYASLKKLHEVLLRQMEHNRTPRGLIKVVIEGNLMPVACKEYEEIDHIIMSGLDCFGKQSDVATKRKLINVRSVTTTTSK